MQKKLIKIRCFALMLLTIFLSFVNVLEVKAATTSFWKCSIISSALQEKLDYVYTAIRISVPVLVIILIIIDMLQAVTAGSEDDMKKAQKRAIKRLIIGIAVFLLPTILKLLFSLFGNIVGSC